MKLYEVEYEVHEDHEVLWVIWDCTGWIWSYVKSMKLMRLYEDGYEDHEVNWVIWNDIWRSWRAWS